MLLSVTACVTQSCIMYIRTSVKPDILCHNEVVYSCTLRGQLGMSIYTRYKMEGAGMPPDITFTVSQPCMGPTLPHHMHAVSGVMSYLPSIPDFPVKSRFRGLLPGIPENIPEMGGMRRALRAHMHGTRTVLALYLAYTLCLAN